MTLLWVIAALGAIAGALELLFTIAGATTAPQQAAGGALACAMAVVPYVLARSISCGIALDEAKKQTVLLTELLKTQRPWPVIGPVGMAPSPTLPAAPTEPDAPIQEPTYFQTLPKTSGPWESIRQNPMVWLLILIASGAVITLVLAK
ncbi:MAG: hypothetical protein ACKV2U_08975 [Bryobacteraceae bacterium]